MPSRTLRPAGLATQPGLARLRRTAEADWLHVASAPPGSDPGWGVIARALGSLTGAAALTYAVGALIMWIRLELEGWPANIVMQHMGNIQIVVLGLKALLVVAVLEVPLVIAALLVLRALGGRKQLAPWLWRALAGLGAALTLALGSWTLLGIVLPVAAAAAVVTVFWRRAVSGRPAPRSLLVVILAVAAGGAAMCLSVARERFYLDEVTITPPPSQPAALFAFPYFGEADGYLFVPQVGPRRVRLGGRLTWQFTGRVLAVRRSTHTVTFPSAKFTDTYALRSPRDVAVSRAEDLWRFLKESL